MIKTKRVSPFAQFEGKIDMDRIPPPSKLTICESCVDDPPTHPANHSFCREFRDLDTQTGGFRCRCRCAQAAKDVIRREYPMRYPCPFKGHNHAMIICKDCGGSSLIVRHCPFENVHTTNIQQPGVAKQG